MNSKIQPTKLIDLGNGTSIWVAPLDSLREQDLNARVMAPHLFDKLVDHIAKDKRIESLPLCAMKKNQAGNEELQIISGHHRTRAARTAGLTEIHVLVFNDAPEDNYIKAKQISHNSISGSDDVQKLKEIYDSIDDVRAKIETALNPEDLEYKVKEIDGKNLSINLDFEMLNIMFFPHQKEEFEKVLALITAETGDNLFIAEFQAFEKFKKMARKVSRIDNVRNVSAILYKMIKICKEHYEEREKALHAEVASRRSDQADQ